ncbi:ABC transporter ATP-binding protein [Thermodesulfobacterium hydrogeniphilum]|uniref:ABC transporter ATP-binding protein n=1 Tax=Thermodesulfobacterium hydrogeniphilum TaxID=161156 RepID=UPI0005715184|nr:ATP-binding cassette domain-containing protein [Thermodesulfobacterium hydrogeniphilum]
MTPIIEFKNVVSKYGTKVIHKNLTFKIEPGEIVALVGGSGSGKTTVIKLILLLLKPASGKIYFKGKDTSHLTPQEEQEMRDRMGVVFQFSALFASMTVGENIMYPVIKRRKIYNELIKENAFLKLKLAGLDEEVFYMYPEELSGGMKKKAALARALALDPELLILDEPTSGLDPISAEEFDHTIKTLRDLMGITVLMVTHDLSSLRIADKLLVLSKGEIAFYGHPKELSKARDEWIQQLISTSRGEFLNA